MHGQAGLEYYELPESKSRVGISRLDYFNHSRPNVQDPEGLEAGHQERTFHPYHEVSFHYRLCFPRSSFPTVSI